MENDLITETIRDALLDALTEKELGDISVSELARRAHIARGTFYSRFESVDAVYRDAVSQAIDSCRSVGEQMACFNCDIGIERREFCELGLVSDRYSRLLETPEFLPTLLSLRSSRQHRHFEQMAERMGLSEGQAEAVYRFQSSGCHALAASDLNTRPNWKECREAVDCFIAGGIAALAARYGTNG